MTPEPPAQRTTRLRTIIVVSHTHWDREWYCTFQEFRFRLTHMIDRLLDLLLERPDFAHFLLDGQTVLLEDYLTIRPERAQDVSHLVESGRLGIGPWYVQPDEFLVSGEALVRNLLLGRHVAESFGPPIKVGWLPDTFGHVAQLPQILLNFGIDTFVSSRGLGDQMEEPALEFWWEAPNGDQVLALYQEGGYWNAGSLGYPYFWGEIDDRALDPDLALEKVKELADHLSQYAASSTIAIWNGADHMPAQRSLPDLIPRLNAELEQYTIRHGRVEDYANAVRRATPDLPLVRGELRGSRYQNVHAPVLSSRVHLKQANHRAQRLLERYAEPLAAIDWLTGGSYPEEFLREAWRLILRNHPHDSICGCSIDQVHREMLPRFEQGQQIAECVIGSAFEDLSRMVDTSWCPSGALPLMVFNPLPQPRREVVETTLRLPQTHPAYQAVDHRKVPIQLDVLSQSLETYPWMNREVTARDLSLQIPFWRECIREIDGLDITAFDCDTERGAAKLCLHLAEWPLGSNSVVEQLLDAIADWAPDTRIDVRATYVLANLAFVADLPPCGYATYAIGAADEQPDSVCLVSGDSHWLENEHLRVEVGNRGHLTLTDKHSDRSFADLHQIEDTADRGDCYDFCPLPSSDGASVILEIAPQTEIVAAGNLVKRLAIHGRLLVPESLVDGAQRRSDKRVELPITTELKLKAGAHHLEIVTGLNNSARDHRLRLLFPTGIDSDVVHSDGQFSLTTRRAIPEGTGDWRQPPSKAQPHHIWFGTDDGEAGLAVLSEGLPEHAGLKGSDGLTLALTLLRSVGSLSRGDLDTRQGHSGPARPTPEAQCIGSHTFRYGLLPYHGDPVTTEVQLQAASFDAPPVVQVTESRRGEYPPRHSIASVEPSSVILTALKRSEADNRLVLRFYSLNESTVNAIVRLGFRATEAYRSTASERVVEQLTLSPDHSECELQVEPGEIVTLLLEPEKPFTPIDTGERAATG
jgi:alpha-mannosidase